MKLFIRFLVLLLLPFACYKASAQYLEFVENKGQWDSKVAFAGNMTAGAVFLQKDGYKILLHNPKDLQRVAEHFSGHHPVSNVTGGMDHHQDAYRTSTGSNDDDIILHSHAYEVNFLGSVSKTNYAGEKALNTFNNYFIGKDSSKWASNCKIYQAVTFNNVYPNIDVRYYTDNNKLKYDFIVHPGGDINQIAVQYNGVDALQQKNGNVIVKTSVGDVTELSPVSFQVENNLRKNIASKFVVIGNVVRFKIADYNKNATLIIDPSLVFSTFTGSRTDNWGYTATYDGAGNFYAGGIAFGEGYPVSTGAYQTTFKGGDDAEGTQPYDAAIIKFSPDGSKRIYATYLGGAGSEQPHSLIVNNNGELVIAGRTSSADFPVTQSKFGPDNSKQNFDIFIAKLSADGTALLASREFGGTGSDGVNIRPKDKEPLGDDAIRRNYGDDARSEVITDGANNIYLASETQSADFLTTNNAFQKNFGGGQDGVFIKTNSDLSTVLCSSFLGGSGQDGAFVLALDPTTNNVCIGGGTTSSDFPGVNSNSLFSSYQKGACDGFLTLIPNNGNTLIKSTYVGTEGNDLVYGVQYDKFGYPYTMGTTTGTWPIVNAAFNTQAKGKQFIAKLSKDLSDWQYSTAFGKGQAKPDISPTAFLVDRCENVYVSGWGGVFDRAFYSNALTTGLTTTPNAISSRTDGNDFYFFVLEKNAASQLYGSFFGEVGGLGDHVDGGTSRFDKQGVIYQGICANCEQMGTFPTTPGVWSPNNPATGAGAGCNMAAVKIAFELAGVGAGVRASIDGVPRDTSGCVPLTVDFNDTIAIAKKYIWNFGDGSADQTTTIPSISHTYTFVGNFRVRLIAIDSATCNIADTSYTNIRVRDDKANLGLAFQKIIPPCEALKYQFTNTSTAPPNKPFRPGAFVWDFGDGTTSTEDNPIHNYIAPGTYIVKLQLLDTIYCNAPDEIDTTIRVAPNVEARIETPPFGCAPYDAFFNNTSLAGQQFTWDFGDGSPLSNEVSPTHTYINPGNYTITLRAFDASTCNKEDDTTITIIVSPKPTAQFTFSPDPPLENTPETFVNLSTGASRYHWDFGDGEELTTIRLDTTVKHIYNRTGTYNVCLIAYNNFGCTDTICKPVRAIVVPLLDVPNAFTPNGDGTNDLVFVRGYGISKLNWKIYNRWGEMVFQSVSQKIGWDGRYKNVLQPQEVYTYILDAEFTDGTRYQKKGDITLLR